MVTLSADDSIYMFLLFEDDAFNTGVKGRKGKCSETKRGYCILILSGIMVDLVDF